MVSAWFQSGVFYEGEADYTALCGQAPSPEGIPGNTVVLYLQSWCREYAFAGPGDEAGERDLVLIHELFHAFGAVRSCAPNLLEGSHVDNSHDLMVGDGYPYQFPVLLDVDHDDYYDTGRTDCYDTRRTPHLVPQSDDVLPYPVTYVDFPLSPCVDNPLGTTPASTVEDSDIMLTNLTGETITIYGLGLAESASETDGGGAIGGDTSIGDSPAPPGPAPSMVSERYEVGALEPWESGFWSTVPRLTYLITNPSGGCEGILVSPSIDQTAMFWVGVPTDE